MLNKNKKMRGKPWNGRGRGRGGDQGMDDAAPVSLPLNINPDLRIFCTHTGNLSDSWFKM